MTTKAAKLYIKNTHRQGVLQFRPISLIVSSKRLDITALSLRHVHKKKNIYVWLLPSDGAVSCESSGMALTLTVPNLVNPIDLLHIYMPMVMRGL